MSASMRRSLAWLPGPLLAAVIAVFVSSQNVGPGLYLLSVVLGAALLVVAPVVQLMLLSTKKFRGRYGAACATSMLIVVIGAFIVALSGIFNFW
jgi:hypothetical protein